MTKKSASLRQRASNDDDITSSRIGISSDLQTSGQKIWKRYLNLLDLSTSLTVQVYQGFLASDLAKYLPTVWSPLAV